MILVCQCVSVSREGLVVMGDEPIDIKPPGRIIMIDQSEIGNNS